MLELILRFFAALEANRNNDYDPMNVLASDRILVVDDSAENLQFIETVLESADYRIDLASNGQLALEKVLQDPPQLVLSDVMMPRMNGIELTHQIRQQSEANYIPILLITAQQRSDVVEGLDAGADDFIRKPVEIDELLARVRSLLRLKHSIDEQAQMTRQREDFVSRLTHDLRTPLVAAERMLELLQQDAFGVLPQAAQEAVQLLWNNNDHLIQLTNNLLEVYRYEAGRKQLSFTQVNLKEIAIEAVRDLRPLADEKALEIITNLEDITVLGARLELRRVISNLIGNAIKFTDTGYITLHLKHRKEDNIAVLDVSDTGIGIALAEQSNLFDRFHQGSHNRAGSGLGLHLSRQIIEAHSGSISVISQPGAGSTFTVQLPCSNDVRKPQITYHPQGRVEDNRLHPRE